MSQEYESVQILFVIPTSCESESQCSKIMKEAFEVAIEAEINCQWVKGSESNFETLKTDFIIFQEFGGPLYEHVLHSKSVSLISPLVLLKCIRQAKPIPRASIPLVSLALEGCIIVPSCLPKEIKRDLKNKVQSMAGIFSLNLVSGTTHLVTGGVRSDKYNSAVNMGIKIATVELIDALWEESKKERGVHCRNQEFDKYKCPVFLDLNVCSTGFAKTETQVPTLVQKHGGNFSACMDLNKTDILVFKSSASTSSSKYKSAIKRKIDCVSEDWILDSISKGYALPNVQDYAAKTATSTPTKRDDYVDPNFSQMSMIIKPTSSQMSDSIATQFVDPTLNQSTLSCGRKRKSSMNTYDALIDGIDIKSAKSAGLFLEGCIIMLLGFESERNKKLLKILNFSGAVPSLTLNDRITHAIIGNCNCVEFKQITSKHLPCAVVNVKWLVDSMTAGMPIDVDKYLITDESSPSQSPTSAAGSPQCKKALNFLRRDVTHTDEPQPDIPNHDVDKNDQEDLVARYMSQTRDSVDDALAAFTMNAQSIPKTSSETVETNTPKKSNTSLANVSSPSISITMEESVMTVFANLKFMLDDFPQEEHDCLVEQITELQGTVVGRNYKGIPDYAVVQITNQRLQITASNVVTYIWITDCLEQKRLITDLEYYHLPCPISSNALRGLCITFSGVKKFEKEFLSNLIVQMGGVQQDWMSRHTVEEKNTLATTHLISNEAAGKKYVGALKWGLPVVGKEWLLKCSEEGIRVAEDEFLIGDAKNHFNSSIAHSSSKLLTPAKPQATIVTPNRKQGPENIGGFQTPPNLGIAPCSQITPVNEIMDRVRKMCGGIATPGGKQNSPKTPNTNKSYMDVTTPDTPYGACFLNPPPPEVRKYWKHWVQSFPSPVRSPATPLTEIKKKFWSKINPELVASNRDTKKGLTGLENIAPQAQTYHLQEEEKSTSQSACNDTENAMNEIVLGQLDELENAMLSHAGSARRQSVRHMDTDYPGGMVPEKESQPLTVGWDENMVSHWSAESPTKTVKNFMISGVDMDERANIVSILDSLGATVSELSNYDPAATHLLCEKLNRNEKLLASLASGLWILHTSYVTDSAAAGKLLNEEDYEFGNPKVMQKFRLDNEGMKKAAAARYWREEIARRGYGAFHDIRAIVHANRKEPMIRVLEAGGAMIVDACPPFDDNISATHCFVEVKNNDLTPYIPLAQQGILCVNTLYVNDFLQRTGQHINEFIITGFQKYYS